MVEVYSGSRDVTSYLRTDFFGVKGEGESNNTSYVIADLSKRDWGKR